MKKLDIKTPSCESTVWCGEGALAKVLPEALEGRQIFTVTDSNVYELYRELVSRELAPRGRIHGVSQLLGADGGGLDVKIVPAPRLGDELFHNKLRHRTAADVAVADEKYFGHLTNSR